MTKKKKIDTGFNSKEQAANLGYTAVTIQRIFDGRILHLNANLQTYSFADKLDESNTPYEYTYERLMDDLRARGKFKVISWAKNVNPETYQKIFNQND